MKHLIKHTFESTMTTDQYDTFKPYMRYWNVYDLINKQKIKYLKVESLKDLHFAFPMEEGRYLISNNTNRYILEVDFVGDFTVNELNAKRDRKAYMFV